MISRLLPTFLCLLAIVPLHAAAVPEITAKSAILLDANTGKVLYSKNDTAQRAVASTQKLLTALIVHNSAPVVSLCSARRRQASHQGTAFAIALVEIEAHLHVAPPRARVAPRHRMTHPVDACRDALRLVQDSPVVRRKRIALAFHREEALFEAHLYAHQGEPSAFRATAVEREVGARVRNPSEDPQRGVRLRG